MKATLYSEGEQHLLNLTPENDAEAAAMVGFTEALARVHLINCRGVKYMLPGVEFLIQPYSRGD